MGGVEGLRVPDVTREAPSPGSGGIRQQGDALWSVKAVLEAPVARGQKAGVARGC